METFGVSEQFVAHIDALLKCEKQRLLCHREVAVDLSAHDDVSESGEALRVERLGEKVCQVEFGRNEEHIDEFFFYVLSNFEVSYVKVLGSLVLIGVVSCEGLGIG